MLPVLHGAARAITPSEFIEALYAITPPRFPSARATGRRSVMLAVSGGVDSMALAYLCSRARRTDAWLKLADHPVKQFTASIVDHGLRAGSDAEAAAVARLLRTRLDMPTQIHTVRWARELGPDADVSPEALGRLPNIESLARRARYRLLGSYAKQADVTSVLLAHHSDDQYETVLMRLLSGHGVRGLRGIRPAADIPECADLHGVYQSGFLDDLARDNPLYRFGITRRQRRHLKHAMRTEIDPAVLAREMHDGLYADGIERHPYLYGWSSATTARERGRRRTEPPPLEPMDIEDGGVQIYRPLLGFGKDRLVATCLHNDIPWFEDSTNADPTLTMRNAVRHLVRDQDSLPVALRKPSILSLAERCGARARREDAEAERLLGRCELLDFAPNTGCATVRLPEVRMPRVPRRGSALRRERKGAHYIRVAGVLVQKLLGLVTPEQQITPLKDLGWVVARLFPSLDEGNNMRGNVEEEAKAFTICGVHFVPLDRKRTWHLSRAPHASQQTRPAMQIHKLAYTRRWRTAPRKWVFSRWSNWALYDNRFWASLRCRVPFDVTVAPFEPEHAKALRQAMGADPRARVELDAALRRYAPGKVRYTLPAIYVRGDIGALIAGEEDWAIHDVIVQGRDRDVDCDDAVELGDGRRQWRHRESSTRKITRCKPPVLRRYGWSREGARQMLEDEKVRLVALPTLGIGIPGVESWVEWRFRYRKVELETLALAGRYLKDSRRKKGDSRRKMQGKCGRVRSR